MRPRLQDVADLAGVSAKTVSNVVNGYPFMREETRQRVLDAMAQLNYRVNVSARNLARGRTGVIALAIPRLANPYFADLAGHVIEAAERRSWTVLIDETRGESERERRVIEGLSPHPMDGLVISVQGLTKAELEEIRPNAALVLLGEKIFDGPADHVVADNVAAAERLTQHLLGIGRRRIAVIGFSGPPLRGSPDLRLEGYRRALAAAGVPWRDEYVRAVSAYERSDGAAAIGELLDLADRPDAVICFNDVMAIGALKALSIRGVGVPDEIAVAAFDDTDDSRFSIPSLTTVSWHNERIADAAVELLEQRISGRDQPPPREIDIEFELIVRDSTVLGADPPVGSGEPATAAPGVSPPGSS